MSTYSGVARDAARGEDEFDPAVQTVLSDGDGFTMSVFLFVCAPEHGAYFATYALARALSARGHKVLYTSVGDFSKELEKQGWDFVPMFPNVKDADPDVGEIPAAFIKRMLYYHKRIRRNPEQHLGLFDAIVHGEFEALLEGHNVDVVLLDPFLNRLAMVCAAANIPVISLATELINYRNHSLPPGYSLFVPGESLWSRFRCRALWAQRFLAVHVRRGLLWVLLKVVFLPIPPRHLRRKFNRMTRDSKLGFMFSEYSWRFDLPEAVLCPSAFDFPNAVTPDGRTYLGVTIDRARVDSDFGHEIPENKRLVYVSLGTHAALYGNRIDRLIGQMSEVAAQRPEWFFVANIGKGNDPGKYGDIPENVLLADFVPQLQILDQSSAIVTNGGLGTVKEAIMAEVPMLVVPCRWDQFGNAARVKYHGIGDFCRLEELSVEELVSRLDDVLNNRQYRDNLARMKRQILNDDEFTKGIDWIERTAAEMAAAKRSRMVRP